MSILDFFKTKKPVIDIAPILPEQIYAEGVLELKDIIAPSALKVTPREINLGEKIARTFFVISYPRFLNEGWFAPIINLSKVFDISIFIHPIDTGSILRQFRKKVAEVESQINTRVEKGLVRDPMLDTAYRDLEKLRDDLQQANERIFDVGLYVTMYGDSTEELDKVESEIKSILDARLVYVKPALFQQEQGFKSVLPLETDLLNVHSKLNSAPLSSLFPFVSFDLTSDRGILYGINRHNSSLVLFDRFSMENFNSVVFAKSGGGKSIRGNEPVLIRHKEVVRMATIGPLIEKTIKKHGITYRDNELEGVANPGIEVFSFDKNMKGGWSTVSVAARKNAPDTLCRFETKSGRQVSTTGDHNMVVLRKAHIVTVKSADIEEGDVVPLPRRIENDAASGSATLNLWTLLRHEPLLYVGGAEWLMRKNYGSLKKQAIDPRLDKYLPHYRRGRLIPMKYFAQIAKKLRLTEEDIAHEQLRITSRLDGFSLPTRLAVTGPLLSILGYIVSEGTVTRDSVLISNTDPEVIEDIKKSFEDMGVPFYEVPRALATSSRPFVALIHAFCGRRTSAFKKIPDFIFGLDKTHIASFLTAYFEGDGGVEKQSIVTATSKSKRLISELSYALLYFGIICRMSRTRSCATNTVQRTKRTYYTLSISGQENLRRFREHIGFVSARKNALLEKACAKKENTNVDVIPTVAPLLDELWKLFGSQMRNLPLFSALRQGAFLPSPTTLKRLVSDIESRVENYRELRHSLAFLRNLPALETLANLAAEDRELTRRLWQTLGSSWPIIRDGERSVGTVNALRAFATVSRKETMTLQEIKSAVYRGCRDMAVPMKSIDVSLQSALTTRPESDTAYEMLRKAGAFIADTYESMERSLPRIEEILKDLKILGEADLFWDPIVRVKKEKSADAYVYDLTVGNEVFLAGHGGMFVHNSYALKLEILRTLMFDTEVIVIDPEREYEYIAEAMGGRYFNISLSSEHRINPFDLPVPREDESPADVLRSHIVTLVGLFRIMLGGISAEEDAVIDRAITETYALKDITPESNFANAEPPLMSDFELVLAGMENTESLVQKLSKYTRGTWAGFINRPSNVDINKKFVVFSVRDMEDELKPVAMYIVMHYIWNAVRKNLRKRLLVIDEAWWMMKSEDTASFLFGLAKRGRKYFLGLATITQDVGDFLKSPYGIPIITNSSIQLLLKQSPTTIDVVQKTFNLTDEEKYLLLESDVGEGIFFAGLKHVAIKIIASYTEDQIITSDPSQLLAIKKAKEEMEGE